LRLESRTWTSDLLEAGVNLATVQRMTGHALGLDDEEIRSA
jgi:hypothetical protein